MKKVLCFLLILLLLASVALPAFGAEQPPEDLLLTLVNPWNPLPEGWKVEPVSIGNGHRVDKTCYDDLMAMMDACRAQGLSPMVRSSYRTQSVQEQLHENKVRQWISYGLSEEDARRKAATIVAIPGTSEHQLGWAVDIVDKSYQTLDEWQAETPAQIWLMAHSWEYGFILRYPSDKSDVTGIIYEPWHYRYVGRENARIIFESGLCLEEFLQTRQQQTAIRNGVKNALAQLYQGTARRIFLLLTRPAEVFRSIVTQTAPAISAVDVMKP